MKKIFLLIAVILPLLNFAQQNTEKKNVTDELGHKQGYWKPYDDMGNVRYEGQFLDNEPFGEFKYYYPNGKIKAISQIYNEGRESRTIAYHHNGSLMATGKYFDRKKDSIWHYYSQYDGILLSEELYVNTIKQGIWRNFYPEEKVAEEKTYVNDKLHGPWIQYYTDGQIKLKGQYQNHEKEGVFVFYHQDGKVETTGSYLVSYKDGIWQEFDEEGILVKELKYKQGKIIK